MRIGKMKIEFEITDQGTIEIIETMVYLGYGTPEQILLKGFDSFYNNLYESDKDKISQLIELKKNGLL
tara:strand:- start:683 stop:886 length:204 start_codon:yes stop_codon:yes gene_type:complete